MFKINPEQKHLVDAHVRSVTRLARQHLDPEECLPEWRLFQRAFIAGIVDFESLFVLSMTGIYFTSPKIIDNIRSPI